MGNQRSKSHYKHYIGFKSLFYFCSLPVRLDAYRGCSYGCLYCFSRRLNNREHDFGSICPADPTKFSNYLKGVLKGRTKAGLIPSCLRRRVPLHFGCVSDPFQPLERKFRVAYHMLESLAAQQYPTVISTKSALISAPPYLDLLGQMPVVVQVSFGTFDDTLARKLEPRAPSPSERLGALTMLAARGVTTVARLQPFLFPREQLSGYTFDRLRKAGVKHVLLEHLRIPTNSHSGVRARLTRALGVDMLAEFSRYGMKCSRVSFELASSSKVGNVVAARELAHSHGMSFGSGDNDFHHFSDDLCCCGVPKTPEFKNTYSGHLGRGAFQGIRRGKVDFSYIDRVWQPTGSVKEYVNSDCRGNASFLPRDLLAARIKSPRSSNSPACFYGVEFDSSAAYRINLDVFKQARKLQL